MLRESVRSSNLRSVGYDAQQKILEIEFNSGGIYQYRSVPSEIHVNLMGAISHGKFFAQFIKESLPNNESGLR